MRLFSPLILSQEKIFDKSYDAINVIKGDRDHDL